MSDDGMNDEAAAASEPPPPEPRIELDPATSELVLRRAFELERREPQRDTSFTKGTLAEIADAVDLPAEAVAAALAEVQLDPEGQRSLADRLIGPDRIVVQRPSTALEREMRDRATEWLETGHGLRPRMRADGVIVATKRKDVVGKIAQSVRGVQGEGRLGKIRRVEFVAVDVGETPGALGLAADVGDRRFNATLGGAAVAAGASTVVGLAALVTAPVALAGIPVALGAGALTSRLVHRNTVRDVTDDLEEALDVMASGDAPTSMLSRATDRLAREAKSRLSRRSRSETPPTPPPSPPNL